MRRRRALMDTQAFMYNEYDAYLDRLSKHVRELSNPIVKTFKIGKGMIKTEQRNKMDNPNGRNKWNGWVAVGMMYSIVVMDQDGMVVTTADFENKDMANKFFKEAKKICMEFEEPKFF